MLPGLLLIVLAAGSAAGAAIEPTAGVVSGVVAYDGPLRDGVAAITQDAATCAPAGAAPLEGSLILHEGRVANVLIRLEGPPSAPPEPRTVEIENVACAFQPRVAVVPLGGRLAIRNSDPVLHGTSLTSVAQERQLANVALPPGGPGAERVMRVPGLVQVGCEVHPWMRAWVHVATDAWAVVSGPDGGFRLDGVPAGTWTLVAWHERLGEQRIPVIVPEGSGAAVGVTF